MSILSTIIFFVLLIGGVFVAPKLKTEIGVLMLMLAYIVGRWVYGLSTSDMAATFPADTVICIIAINLFFGFIHTAGVMQGIVDRLLYMTKGNTKVLPLIIILSAFCLTALGAGSFGTGAIVSALIFTLVADIGLNPLIGIASMFLGATLGLMPWTDAGAISAGMIDQFVEIGFGWSAQIGSAVLATSVVFIYYIVLLIFTKNKITVTHYEFKKPEPFTKKQKQLLGLLGIIFAFIIIPAVIQMIVPNSVTAWMVSNLEIRVLFVTGSVIAAMMNLGKTKDAIAKIPWGLVLMFAGTTMFVKLSTTIGLTDTLLAAATDTIPSWLILPLVMVIAGLIGMHVNAFVVITTFLPMVPALASVAGVSTFAMAMAINICTMVPAFSPFSMGGAACIMGCTDDSIREPLVRKQLISAYILLGCMFLLGVSGIFKLF